MTAITRDGPASVPSLRTLGTGANQALPGNTVLTGVAVFNVKSYGAIGNNVADDSAAFVSAHAAAVAAGGGLVYIPPGTYLLGTNQNNTGIIQAAKNLSGTIRWQGAGRGVSNIHLKSPVSSFQLANPDNTHPTYRNYEFADFTIDGTGTAENNAGYLVHYSTSSGGSTFDVGYHLIERVSSRVFGHTNASRCMVRMAINRTSLASAQAAQTCYFKELYMRDVQIGVRGFGTGTTQGGGISGVRVSGFVSVSGGDKDAAGLWKPSVLYGQQGNPANLVVDGIYLSDVTHWSGQAPVNPASPGAPFILGGDGLVRYARIRDCTAWNTGDIGFEIDNGFDVIIEGCTVHNNDGNAFLIMPFAGGTGTDEANILVKDCTDIWEAVDDNGNPITGWSPTGAFVSNTRYGAANRGSVIFENCTARMESGWNATWSAFIIGPARSTTVKDCRSICVGSPDTGGGGHTLNHLIVRAPGRDMVLNIENFQSIYNATTDTTNVLDDTLAIAEAASLHLYVRGLSAYESGSQLNGAARKPTIASINCNGGNTVQEPFTSDELGAVCIFDNGAAANYTGPATGAYTAAANLTTENRGYYVATGTTTTSLSFIGRVQDGSHYTKFVTGASRTLYKAGAYGKRQSATTYLESYVYDDGTNTYLCLDKVTAGTRASLLGTIGGTASGYNGAGSLTVTAIGTTAAYTSDRGIVLASRLGTAATHYPSLTVIGDKVYAENWTTAEPTTTNLHPSTTGDAHVTVTLTGADSTTFGAKSNMGEFGFTHVPIDAAATLAKLTHRRLGVISGSIRDVAALELNTPASTSTGIQIQPNYAGRFRVGSALRIAGADFARLGPAGSTVTDLDVIADAGVTTNLRTSDVTHWTGGFTDSWGVPSGGSSLDVLTKNSGTDGDFAWAAASGGGGGGGFPTLASVMLTADASTVSGSTTLADITGLSLPLVATGYYEFEIHLRLTGTGGAGDFKLGLSGPSGISGSWALIGTVGVNQMGYVSAGTSTGTPNAENALTATCSGGTISGTVLVVARGWCKTTGTSGTLQVRLAQAASNAEVLTPKEGSALKLARHS